MQYLAWSESWLLALPTLLDIYSPRHLHLHVLSADLYSPRMKLKKHYNSFHPKLGFFLHLSDVLSWFDADPSYYQTVRRFLCTS